LQVPLRAGLCEIDLLIPKFSPCEREDGRMG
jgi:hypothetical protein